MKLNKIIISLLAILLFGACEVEIEEAPENSTYITGTIDAGDLNTSNLEVLSILDKSEVGYNKFTIETYECDLPQMLFVKNENEKIIMLYRDLVSTKEEIEINAYSTAIAFLTFHPALSTIHGEDYKEIINILTSAKSFNNYLNAIKNSIAQNREIFDTTNVELINCTQEIFSELFSDTTRLYNGQSNAKDLSFLTELYDCEPIDVRSEGRKLIFRMPGLYPAYKCTVTSQSGTKIGEFKVPSRDNYGALNVVQCMVGQGNWAYGEEVQYTLPSYEQKANFYFKRDGFDLFCQLATSALQTIGAPIVNNKKIEDIANGIQIALNSVNINLEGLDISATFWNVVLPIVIDVTLEKLSNPVGNSYIEDYIGYYAIDIAKGLNVYNRIEGGANALLRALWLLRCHKEYEFCTQYFSDKFGLCTDAKLRKVSGDNQTGYPNQKLKNPIIVEVVTEHDLTDKNYIVKFVSDNGHGWYDEVEVAIDNNKKASYEWTLNENDETQYAWAQLIDKDNNIMLDSVKFTANEKHDLWNVGLRCDIQSSYVHTFIMDLGVGGDYQIPPTTVNSFDYDGDAITLIYDGSFINNVLNLSLSSYMYGECFRRDVFNGTITGNSATITGVLTYDNGAGCTIMLDMEKADSNAKKSDILSKKVNDSNSKTNGCTISMH